MNELDALWALLVAGAAALVLTPLAARFATRVGAVATPRDRDLHDSPTPRMGGLAILAGVLLAGALFLPGGEETRGILVGAAVAALIGAADDKFDLPPAVKLIGQLAAATIPVASDVYVQNVTLPFVDPLDLGSFGQPLTLLGIVAVMNVVNFTDGADGLAAGVCTIAAATFAIIALSLYDESADPDRLAAGILAALTAGAAAGFLWHNFHPASVFMGDSGSNLLGILLAAVAIQGVLKTAAVVALFFPLVILAVPALDATFVVAKRIKYRRPVYSADRWHFHHRFTNIGFSQRKTVLYLYGWTLSLAALALALRFVPYSDDNGNLNAGWSAVILAFAALAFAASLYLVLVLEILKFSRFRERQLRRASETGELPALSDAEIEAEIEREVETGEFEAV
jgi:UDP-GlcNAc:undecaprenyl-phosphate/decaprenyl-phosphate GlcNAc-1-phosphate transferase